MSYEELSLWIHQGKWARIVRTGMQRYKFLFIPGFHYLSDNTSGADFSKKQRQMMHQLGLDVQLATTEEDGTVEENAKSSLEIALRQSRSYTHLILVSTSKGGARHRPRFGKNIRAWRDNFCQSMVERWRIDFEKHTGRSHNDLAQILDCQNYIFARKG